MTDTLSDNINFKPICFGSPHPLQELASIKMALNIRIQKFNQHYPTGSNSPVQFTELEFHTDISIAIPPKIRRIIDAQLYPIDLKLGHCVSYLHSAVNLSYDRIYSRLNLIAFGGNGTVHYKDTIANFLEDDSLDNVTRFKIACVHCMEEKIDFFWPLVNETLIIDNNLKFYGDCMLWYWINRKNGEMDRFSSSVGFGFVEGFLISNCRQRLMYLSIEYFLTFLNPNDRFFHLYAMLYLDPLLYEINGGKCEDFLRFFPNIDGPMQRRILDKMTPSILYMFAECLNPIEYTVQCFIYMRNIITPKSYCQHVVKMLELFHLSQTGKGYWHTRLEIILEQIWLNTPINLKKYAMENLSTILDAYNRKSVGDCFLDFSRDIRFLLAVLSDVDFSSRNNLWIKYWPKWIDGVPLCQFEELIRLCLSKTEAIEEFKNAFPYTEAFQEYCLRLICLGYYTELDKFLSTLYSNPELVLDIKKHILKNESKIFSKEPESVKKFAEYIDKIFSDGSAADFKNNLIFSDPVLKVLVQKGITDSSDDSSGIEFIVSLFVLPQKHSEIKNKFLELFHQIITSGKLHTFNEVRWSKFLMWCSDNDEQRVIDFTKSLQIGVVFEAAFFEYVQDANFQSHGITSLNRFLMWYFKSKSTCERFICGRIEYYGEMDEAEVEGIFGHRYLFVINSMRNGLLESFF